MNFTDSTFPTGYFNIFFNKLAVTVHRCLDGRTPPYLMDYCIAVSGADSRRHLRSANRHLLAVLRFWLNTYGRPAFPVADSTVWNSLTNEPVDQYILFQTCSQNAFVRSLLLHASSALGVL